MIELVALFYFDGKIDEESSYEIKQCKTIIDQIKNDQNISQRTLALCWIYLQAHKKDPLGKFIKVLRFFLIKIISRLDFSLSRLLTMTFGFLISIISKML